MFYKNIYFHNVNSMQKTDDGNYLLSRYNETLLGDAEVKFNDGKLSTGVELRFKVISDTVKIKLKLENGQSPAVCEVYFGNYFAGNNYVLEITEDGVEYTFEKAKMPQISALTYKDFSPNVVRILLPAKNVLFVSVDGETEYPQKYEMPNKTIAFVGSTSLGYGDFDKPSNSIPFQLSSNLKVDYLNLCYFDNEASFNKLFPTLLTLDKNIIFVAEVITEQIDNTNLKKQLKYTARKIKLLSKLKGRVLFVDSFTPCLHLTKERANKKVGAKINKMLKKKVSAKPTELYASSILNGVKTLNIVAMDLATKELAYLVKDNFKNFNKEVKISKTPVRYFKTTAGDEPSFTAPIMNKRDIKEQNKKDKAELQEKKAKEQQELETKKEEARLKKEQEKLLKAQQKEQLKNKKLPKNSDEEVETNSNNED